MSPAIIGGGRGPQVGQLVQTESIVTTTGQNRNIAPASGKRLRIWGIFISVATDSNFNGGGDRIYFYFNDTGNPIGRVTLGPGAQTLNVLVQFPYPLVGDVDEYVTFSNAGFTAGTCTACLLFLNDEV